MFARVCWYYSPAWCNIGPLWYDNLQYSNDESQDNLTLWTSKITWDLNLTGELSLQESRAECLGGA